MGKMRGVAAGCLLAIGVVASVASSSEEATRVDDGSTDDAGAAPASETFVVGDTVELGDLRLVVHGVTDPLASSNPIMTPPPGTRWVAVDAEITNLTDQPVTVSSLLQFELQDATNAAYDVTITAENLPAIDGEVAAGGSRRGTLTFEVPEATTGLRLAFAGDMLASGSAVIALG